MSEDNRYSLDLRDVVEMERLADDLNSLGVPPLSMHQDDVFLTNDELENLMDSLVIAPESLEESGGSATVSEIEYLKLENCNLKCENDMLKEINEFIYLYNKLLIAEAKRLHRRNVKLQEEYDKIVANLKLKIGVLDDFLKEEIVTLLDELFNPLTAEGEPSKRRAKRIDEAPTNGRRAKRVYEAPTNGRRAKKARKCFICDN